LDEEKTAVARRCLDGAEANTMTFPEIVALLGQTGFESYAVDFRRNTATYYLPEGDSVELATHESGGTVAAALDQPALQAAIREAQTSAPGYTYKSFCTKAKQAGCAGYMVSFSGRRAVYFGRTGDIHVEPFPQ
jgi:uncharacterized protein YbcV (DUF1398 family)